MWTPYDPITEPYLEFGTRIASGTHLLKPQLDFLESALARRTPEYVVSDITANIAAMASANGQRCLPHACDRLLL